MENINNPEELIRALQEGSLSRDVQILLARGIFPVEPELILLAVLFFLQSSDKELTSHASKTLKEMPTRLLQRMIQNPNLDAGVLDILAKHVKGIPVLETILTHRNIDPSTVEFIATSAPPTLQDIIITNINLIIQHPSILETLDHNEKLSSHVRLRIAEIKRDYLGITTGEDASELSEESEEMGETPDGPEMVEGIEDLESFGGMEFSTDFEIPQELFDTFNMDALPEDDLFSDLNISLDELDDEDDLTLYQKVLILSVPQKIELGLKGNKEARGVLIRDANKLVKAAVVMSPKITEAEIFTFTGMRDLPSELLRLIATKREYMRKYTIVRQLVFNPKTPVGVTLTFLPRMSKRDLHDLVKDKDVPDPLRQAARRLKETRERDH